MIETLHGRTAYGSREYRYTITIQTLAPLGTTNDEFAAHLSMLTERCEGGDNTDIRARAEVVHYQHGCSDLDAARKVKDQLETWIQNRNGRR